jgi:hypothetical protein
MASPFVPLSSSSDIREYQYIVEEELFLTLSPLPFDLFLPLPSRELQNLWSPAYTQNFFSDTNKFYNLNQKYLYKKTPQAFRGDLLTHSVDRTSKYL